MIGTAPGPSRAGCAIVQFGIGRQRVAGTPPARRVVDVHVVAYWREHYDIARVLQRDWATLEPDLDGKIHVIVGDADTFYLDGAARRLKAVLEGLGAKADVRFLPGKTHFDLYAEGDDRRALLKKIAWEMHAVARPRSRPPVSATPGA